MTMNFIVVKNALITLLGTEGNGEFKTIGYQQQGVGADEIEDNNRQAQVYFSEGAFPKSGGSINGPFKHNITFRIELMVSSRASCDLSVINNPASTPPEIAAAIAALTEAASLADDSLDEFFEKVFQILMNAENVDIGLPRPVGNRWIDSFKKNEPLPRGEYVVLTGEMLFTCTMEEAVLGETPTEATGIGNEIEIDEDTTGKAGVEVDPTA